MQPQKSAFLFQKKYIPVNPKAPIVFMLLMKYIHILTVTTIWFHQAVKMAPFISTRIVKL